MPLGEAQGGDESPEAKEWDVGKSEEVGTCPVFGDDPLVRRQDLRGKGPSGHPGKRPQAPKFTTWHVLWGHRRAAQPAWARCGLSSRKCRQMTNCQR